MLNRAVAFLARIAVGKQLVAGIATVHDKLDGSRSEIALAISAIVYLLKLVGIIPGPIADNIELALAPLLTALLADRFSKVKSVVDSVVPDASVPLPNAELPK